MCADCHWGPLADARTVKEAFADCRGKFGRCESGVIWGLVPFVLCGQAVWRGRNNPILVTC